MHSSKVRTAIFPVAGLGTRFLPATKATPKELLPVIDTPLIQYAIDEARAAGIERMIFVSHPSKGAIERYVSADAKLSSQLRAKGKDKIADKLDAACIDDSSEDAIFVMQHEPLGLGHAVLCAAEQALPGPVAVVLPDDLILGEKGCLAEMIEAHEAGVAGHIVAAMDVPRENVYKYGILEVSHRQGEVSRALGMVEKPEPEAAPSNTAVVGRYVLDESIFDDLRTQEPGAGGEIQLTDAIARGIGRVGLAGFHFSGQRFDCGSKEGMLRATLKLASQDPAFDQVIAEFTPVPASDLAAE
ncbi:UTP--glucose-1-phosphate uridylyltransferase [Poseidonocella sedimentorum]|uniref:UTP--glucose-1-phosphate uridylyltransferase n=1 Tax=Poseidonocella sedimentorum TaxID=871652 RepID=A0A1I6E879_9RHOB|nr:UTP--glucose-1-phosphate uridylyltransferase [Poseidonocella sedimentorum]SFR13943.1 UTP--glucose-1-phosphate uridylyltransferase [Poseidonocella sedimentorum]